MLLALRAVALTLKEGLGLRTSITKNLQSARYLSLLNEWGPQKST